MQNISFQGRSNLIFSDVKYNDLLQYKSIIRRKCNQGANQLFPAKSIGIDLDNSSIFVIVKNEHDGFIQKFQKEKKLNTLILELEERVEKLKYKAKDTMTAWILGGKANDNNTIKTVNEIADIICDRPDIDASILVGDKFDNVERIFVKGNTQGTEIVFPKHSKAKNENDLNYFFDIAELNNTQVSF